MMFSSSGFSASLGLLLRESGRDQVVVRADALRFEILKRGGRQSAEIRRRGEQIVEAADLREERLVILREVAPP
jgi:hypothetical protein